MARGNGKTDRIRRPRRRQRRSVRRTARTLALVATAVLAAAAIAPSAWVDAKHMMRDHLDVLEHTLASVTVHVAAWVGVGTERDALTRGSKGATISGPARVVDGDTLEVRGARMRLYGIDAPESKQRCRKGGRTWSCGREAARALAQAIGSRTVVCEARDRDRYGRVVAVCRSRGADVNAWMVAEGWAFAYRKYSRDYVGEEASARAAKRGVWRGDVVAPWDWRRGERLAGEGTTAQPAPSRPAAQADGARCAIKGNIGKGGTRIYHVPGGRFYDRTRIDTSKGERWFCTTAEARAAGWRRSRR